MDDREELARQLEREHREGMGADRLEAERKRFYWDIEGWTGEDELQVHIAGMGTLRIAADDVVRFANALLAEHELRFRPEDEPCRGCGGTDMPLHTDYMCPNCHELDERVDRHGSEFYPSADPRWWRTNADGSLVCPHRNMSVCPDCARLPGATEVAGAHYWDPDGEIARSTDG